MRWTMVRKLSNKAVWTFAFGVGKGWKSIALALLLLYSELESKTLSDTKQLCTLAMPPPNAPYSRDACIQNHNPAPPHPLTS